MRKVALFLGGSFFIMMCVAWVEGQQPGGKGGGGFGGFQQTPLSLLNRPEVKEELKLTEAQSEKLPAEVMKAIENVLDKQQLARFKQIELQTRGNGAFKDKAVLKQLKVSDAQAKDITGILEESDKELAELRKNLFGGKGGGKGGFEKITNAQKETKEKLLTVLTKDQRKQWREMIGEEFKLQQGGFGGFGGKKGADPKKKDI